MIGMSSDVLVKHEGKRWKIYYSKLMVVLLVGLVIGLGIGYWILPKPLQSAPPPPEEELEFWYERCGEGYPYGTCICGVSMVPVKSPRTFKMSTINFYDDREMISLHTYYFGAELNSGAKIVFIINATAPIDLQLVLVNRTDADVLALGNEVAYYSRVIIEAPKITSYFHELKVQEKGLYIFVFDVEQPKPVATVTFEAEYAL